jgi:HEAT repeat protein
MDQLMNDDPDIRCRAMLRIQDVGQPELMHQILCEIQPALHSRSQEVRDKASTLLYFLGPRLFGMPPPPPSLDTLTTSLASPYPDVRCHAAEALGDLGKAAQPALGLLKQLLTDPDPKVQLSAAVAITGITGALPEKPPSAPERKRAEEPAEPE